MKKLLLIVALLQGLSGIVFSQGFLTEEQEREIKLSDKYYWEEGNDYDADRAFKNAINSLTDLIIIDPAYQHNNREDIMKRIEKNARHGRISQDGMACVLVWIAKDNLYGTENVQSNLPEEPESPQLVSVDDPVLLELAKCKDCKEVNQVVNRHGWIRGRLNSSEGFAHPELCVMAVFDTNGALIAFLDKEKGGSSRMDLISGQLISNPVTKYQKEGMYLWYLQQK